MAALRVLGVNAAMCESGLSGALPFLHERLMGENLFGKAPENFLEREVTEDSLHTFHAAPVTLSCLICVVRIGLVRLFLDYHFIL